MINNVVLVGRAGKDPEMRYFESGKVKTELSMAVTRPTKEKETDWFNVELWGKTAEVAGEYVRKGHQFGVEGRIETWEKDGKRGVTIIANKIALLQPKEESSSSDWD